MLRVRDLVKVYPGPVAALQGVDIDAFLEGARAMDRATRETRAARNPAMVLALAWHHATGGRGQRGGRGTGLGVGLGGE